MLTCRRVSEENVLILDRGNINFYRTAIILQEKVGDADAQTRRKQVGLSLGVSGYNFKISRKVRRYSLSFGENMAFRSDRPRLYA